VARRSTYSAAPKNARPSARLIHEYKTSIDELLATLNAGNLALATEIARIPKTFAATARESTAPRSSAPEVGRADDRVACRRPAACHMPAKGHR